MGGSWPEPNGPFASCSGQLNNSAVKLTLKSRFCLPAAPRVWISLDHVPKGQHWPDDQSRTADGNVVTWPLWGSPTCCMGSSSLRGHGRPRVTTQEYRNSWVCSLLHYVEWSRWFWSPSQRIKQWHCCSSHKIIA